MFLAWNVWRLMEAAENLVPATLTSEVTRD